MINFKRADFTMKYSLLLTGILSFGVLAQSAPSPFEYKKPEPVTQIQLAPAPDADLNEKQKASVNEMITTVIKTTLDGMAQKPNEPFELGGAKVSLLKSDQKYIGRVDQVHVIWDESTQEYSYFDVNEVDKFITSPEYEQMKSDTLEELEKLKQSLLKETQSPVQTPSQQPLNKPAAEASSPALNKSDKTPRRPVSTTAANGKGV